MAPEKHPRDGERGAAAILFVSLVVAAAIVAAASMMIGRPQFAVQQGRGTGFDLTDLRKAVEAHAWATAGGGAATVVCPSATNASGAPTGEVDPAGCAGLVSGVVPWRTIGVTEAKARDAWGNYVTLIRSDDNDLTLVSDRDGTEPRCDFILMSPGANGAWDYEPDPIVDTVTLDTASSEAADIAVCGRLTHGFPFVEVSNKTEWAGNSRDPGTADSPTEFKPQEVRLSDGTQALVMGNPNLDGAGDPLNTAGAMPAWRVGCTWLPPKAFGSWLSAQFRFQFLPGETDDTEAEGTGHGFTITLLPGSATVTSGSPCGLAGENLGHGGIAHPKAGVEFDIHSGETGNPDKNHAAALFSDDSGGVTFAMASTNVSTNVQHGQADTPACSGASCVSGAQDAWLEVRDCDIRDYGACDMERVDWYDYNGVDPTNAAQQDLPVYATKPFKAEVMVLKRCGDTCAVCDDDATFDRLWVRATISCDLPTAIIDLADFEDACEAKTISSCQAVPGGNAADFSSARLGFTYATGATTTGLQISNIGYAAQ